ncbi:hypothetical protein BDZ45DRAFT_382030 [Acephala macrosclerotiorum]|nr:hypothetical protein BDZ45DRAFT_382030 [Acephala macrosclerotiorum]
MMLSRYYAPLLIASPGGTSLAKTTKHTTTTTKSLTTTTKSSTITSSAALTTSATCAAAGANCYNSVVVSVTPCCDANSECVEGDTIATFTCEVIPPYTSPSPLPCTAVYGQCGSVYWTDPTCCDRR